jgi:hypothetical protein
VAACATLGMSCMNAVDTNVFVYSLDANEPVKQPKAKALLAGLVGAGRWPGQGAIQMYR